MSHRLRTLTIAAAGVLALPAALTLLSSGSCSLVDLYDGVADGSGGASGAGGDDGGVDAPPPCPDAMVAISLSADAGYCIDKLEVTNRDYRAFFDVADAGPAPDASALCRWNTSYEPTVSLDAGDLLPVLGVDWCDAHDYCLWVGKRLCGKTGGGSLDPTFLDEGESQWFRACSRNGQRVYPYDNNFSGTACVDCDPEAGCREDAGVPDVGPAPVGSKTTCDGGYVGLVDMSGNAAEWEDACEQNGLDDAGKAARRNDTCYHRGGSFVMGASPLGVACLACFTNNVMVGGATVPCSLVGSHRMDQPPDVGLRCCLDY